MANAIDLQSPTLEGQFVELLAAFLELEKDSQINPNNLHYFQGKWQVVGEEFSFQGSFMVKTIGKVNEHGQLVLTPVEYLQNVTQNSPMEDDI